jgi:hypothetical protein
MVKLAIYIYLFFSRLREWFVQHENGHLTVTLVDGTFSDSLLFLFFVWFLGASGCSFCFEKIVYFADQPRLYPTHTKVINYCCGTGKFRNIAAKMGFL